MCENNIHQGHRARMLDKVVRGADNLADHEILEVILYYALPRIDVNPLAHSLLTRFGSLAGVFGATEQQLLSVKGIGKRGAAEILAIGSVVKRISAKEKSAVGLKRWQSLDANRADVFKMFEGMIEERFVVLLLNNRFELLNKITFDGNRGDRVQIDPSEIIASVSLLKPRFMVAAHNHPSGSVTPSAADDFATAKLNLLCVAHDVELIEHVIVSPSSGKIYSYHNDENGRLEKIKNQTCLDNILDKFQENFGNDGNEKNNYDKYKNFRFGDE